MRSFLLAVLLALALILLFVWNGKRAPEQATPTMRPAPSAEAPKRIDAEPGAERGGKRGPARVPLGGETEARKHSFVGRCIDERGAPLEGVLVEGVELIEGNATSDAAGHYELAFDPERLARRAGRLRLTRRGLADTSVRLPPGLQGEVRLGPTRMQGGGTLRGRVLDAGRTPAPDAAVFLTGRPRGDLIHRSTRTDANGSWNLDGLPYGDFDLRVRWLGAREQHVTQVQVSNVELDLGDVHLSPVHPSCLLRGRVYGTDGAATPRAELRFYRSDHGASHRGTLAVGQDGSFTLAGEARAAYEVVAVDPETGARSKTLQARCGGPELALRLHPLPPAELLVTDDEGAPITEFSCWIFDPTPGVERGSAPPITRHEQGRVRVADTGRALNVTIRAKGFETLTLRSLSFETGRLQTLGSAMSGFQSPRGSLADNGPPWTPGFYLDSAAKVRVVRLSRPSSAPRDR